MQEVKERYPTGAGRTREAGRAPARRRSARRRKRRRSPFLRTLLLLVVVAAGVTVSGYFLFRFKQIQVVGSTAYTAAQVQSAMGVRDGQNLLLFDRKTAAETLCRKLPYIRSAAVELRPFTTLRVSVKPDSAAAVLRDGAGYLVVDSALKLLEPSQKNPGLPELTGMPISSREPGSRVTGQAKTVAAAGALLNALTENKVPAAKVSNVAVADPYELQFCYDGRITVVLGTSSNLSYKVKTAVYLLTTQLSAGSKGRLDVSRAMADTTSEHKMYFIPS